MHLQNSSSSNSLGRDGVRDQCTLKVPLCDVALLCPESELSYFSLLFVECFYAMRGCDAAVVLQIHVAAYCALISPCRQARST